jgi:O-antigen/teichoic acid export membrane protein
MARFSFWAALAAIMWQVLLGYPLWYLQKVEGPSPAGVFAGVQLLASTLLVIANAIVIVVQTSVTKLWESRGPQEAERNLLLAHKVTTLLLLIAALAISAAAPLMVHVLPASYRQGASVMPPLLLFYLLAGHLLFLGIHFSLIERTRHLFVPWLLGAAGHVLFSWHLVRPHLAPLGAMQAASWAGILGMSLGLAASLALVLLERRPLDIGNWLLIAAGYVLVSPAAWVPPAILGTLLVLTLATDLILTPEEKRRLQKQLAAARQIIARKLL